VGDQREASQQVLEMEHRRQTVRPHRDLRGVPIQRERALRLRIGPSRTRDFGEFEDDVVGRQVGPPEQAGLGVGDRLRAVAQNEQSLAAAIEHLGAVRRRPAWPHDEVEPGSGVEWPYQRRSRRAGEPSAVSRVADGAWSARSHQ
jgi:hypothetical protein